MSKIAGAVEYSTFDPNQIPTDIKTSKDLEEYVLLQTQGKCIELIENSRTALTMYIFNIIHKVSLELVLVTSEGKKYAIYNHHSWPVFHSVDLDLSICDENDYASFSETKNEISINIEELWSSVPETDISTKIRKTLDKVKSLIKLSPKTTIVGDVPLLLLLATQHLIGDNTRQLFYQKSINSGPKRIK